jgi:hypothetical protein
MDAAALPSRMEHFADRRLDALMGVGVEIAGAETVFMVERNMCNAAMRGIVVPPGSKTTSRANGSRRNLGYPTLDQRRKCSSPHREGEEP